MFGANELFGRCSGLEQFPGEVGVPGSNARSKFDSRWNFCSGNQITVVVRVPVKVTVAFVFSSGSTEK